LGDATMLYILKDILKLLDVRKGEHKEKAEERVKRFVTFN